MRKPDPDELLDAHQAAALAGMKVGSWRWRYRSGDAPGPDVPSMYTPGRGWSKVKWRRETVIDWVNARPGRGARVDTETGRSRVGLEEGE